MNNNIKNDNNTLNTLTKCMKSHLLNLPTIIIIYKDHIQKTSNHKTVKVATKYIAKTNYI